MKAHVGRTHELDESEYHKLDDKIDEKEKAKLRRQAQRRKADSEAEDYDEKKEKRRALAKAKMKRQQAEEKAIRKRNAQMAEIEGTDRQQEVSSSNKRDRKRDRKKKGRKEEEGMVDGMVHGVPGLEEEGVKKAENLTHD